jgi:hypothetical protein
MSVVSDIGALLFGVVIGWITYRTLARRAGGAQISDIATVVAAVGGGAVTALFSQRGLFGMYAIGLFIGFFAYLALFYRLNGRQKTAIIMGEDGLDDAPRFGGGGL